MKSDPLYIEFLKIINADIKIEVDHLIQGKCLTIEEYKHKSGIIKGLKLSIERIEEAFKKVLKDDD